MHTANIKSLIVFLVAMLFGVSGSLISLQAHPIYWSLSQGLFVLAAIYLGVLLLRETGDETPKQNREH